jgi:hypothetical protein
MLAERLKTRHFLSGKVVSSSVSWLLLFVLYSGGNMVDLVFLHSAVGSYALAVITLTEKHCLAIVESTKVEKKHGT